MNIENKQVQLTFYISFHAHLEGSAELIRRNKCDLIIAAGFKQSERKEASAPRRKINE